KSLLYKMQATLWFSPTLIPFTPAKITSTHGNPLPKLVSSRASSIKATAVTNETTTVDYSSAFSVFPAEACETIGGDSCSADTCPEAKLKPEATTTTNASELFDREYLEYDDSKSVLPGEACDVLGGEFCEPQYQRGVY
ncbi:hypothetical protein, partial [Vibrio vulnificus]|uniref:hypothetical protein n=2 Tax=Gammaproteobacteria TaxID=1236 RepID=UPI001CCFB1DA